MSTVHRSIAASALQDADRTMSMLHALLVDDDHETRRSLLAILREHGCSVDTVSTGRETVAAFEDGADLVMLSDRLPDGDGIRLMQQLRTLNPSCPIMLMTTSKSVEHAVSALRLGASDYVRKPISDAAVRRFLSETLSSEGTAKAPRGGVDRFLGPSSLIRRMRSSLRRIAATPRATTLLVGETGTGKDLAAQALHEEDPLATGPCLRIACAASTTPVIEAALFGHAGVGDASKTPGTFERARGGTLVVDGVEHLCPSLQDKLVEALDQRSFRRVGGSVEIPLDLRLVFTTRSDLRVAVHRNQFRAELFHRLSRYMLELPPLRDRPGDLEVLARQFGLEISRRELRPPPTFSADAIARLRAHHWPGNVRELRNVIERAILLFHPNRLLPESFDIPSSSMSHATQLNLPAAGIDLRQFERRMVEQALRRAEGNITKAASMLGLNRDQMRYRVTKYGLAR